MKFTSATNFFMADALNSMTAMMPACVSTPRCVRQMQQAIDEFHDGHRRFPRSVEELKAFAATETSDYGWMSLPWFESLHRRMTNMTSNV